MATESELYQYKRNYTQEDIDLMYSHFRENVVEDIISKLPLYLMLPKFQQQFSYVLRRYGIEPKDFPDFLRRKHDYLSAIKDVNELNRQFERCERLIYGNDTGLINMPIVIKFDYQLKNGDDIFGFPTFYSFYNEKLETQFGKGTYVIAFPMSIVYLTDEELIVALKHEFGHIIQGHCEIPPKSNFEANHLNCACDISINIGMSNEEQDLLISVAHKLFGEDGFPVISLGHPEGRGGYGIPVPTAVGDFQLPLAYVREYYKKKKEEQQGEQGQQGEPGDGGEGGGQSQDNSEMERINVGDYVVVRDSDPKVYGKVVDMNATTGEYEIEEVDYSQIQNEANLFTE